VPRNAIIVIIGADNGQRTPSEGSQPMVASAWHGFERWGTVGLLSFFTTTTGDKE
jgi:hypothetical protein